MLKLILTICNTDSCMWFSVIPLRLVDIVDFRFLQLMMHKASQYMYVTLCSSQLRCWIWTRIQFTQVSNRWYTNLCKVDASCTAASTQLARAKSWLICPLWKAFYTCMLRRRHALSKYLQYSSQEAPKSRCHLNHIPKSIHGGSSNSLHHPRD